MWIPALLAAAALSLERIGYFLAWRYPAAFHRRCAALGIARDPVSALERLFYAFKAIQFLVFGSWLVYFSGAQWEWDPTVGQAAVGTALVAIGQLLNLSTCYRLGRIGVFYGVRFGHAVPWRTEFPFSVVDHPQYVGTVLSIWGLFIALRFPGADWAIVPIIESLYYALSAVFESERGLRRAEREAIHAPDTLGTRVAAPEAAAID